MYSPGLVTQSTDPREIVKWVFDELRAIETAMQVAAESVYILALHAEPARPRNGMVVYADGTDWNPGSGEGFYGRENGAWVKL